MTFAASVGVGENLPTSVLGDNLPTSVSEDNLPASFFSSDIVLIDVSDPALWGSLASVLVSRFSHVPCQFRGPPLRKPMLY
jgi:hypothetical protein